MRHSTTIALCACLLAVAAHAAEPQRGATSYPLTVGPLTSGTSPSGEYLSTEDILGLEVVNPGGEHLGTITELVLDDGQIVSAVLSVGGFLGIADKRIPVRWSLLELRLAKGAAVLNASRSQLERAAEHAKRSPES